MKKKQTIGQAKQEKPLYSRLFKCKQPHKLAEGRKIAVTSKLAGEIS